MSEPGIPDGYEPVPGGGMRLIDPADCPRGHPFAWGQRGYAPCYPHGGHPLWTCACGQAVYRRDGMFVARLDCVAS